MEYRARRGASERGRARAEQAVMAWQGEETVRARKGESAVRAQQGRVEDAGTGTRRKKG